MAKKKRHTAAEIAAKLEQADALAAAGRTQSEIAQALGISIMTIHRWRKAKPPRPRSEGAQPTTAPPAPASQPPEREAARRVAELQVENARLRKLVTDLLLEKMRLEEEAQSLPKRGAIEKILP